MNSNYLTRKKKDRWSFALLKWLACIQLNLKLPSKISKMEKILFQEPILFKCSKNLNWNPIILKSSLLSFHSAQTISSTSTIMASLRGFMSKTTNTKKMQFRSKDKSQKNPSALKNKLEKELNRELRGRTGWLILCQLSMSRRK